MGGTTAMRTNAATYLPQHPAEKDTHWTERKKKAVLRNYFKRNVSSIVSKVFAQPIVAKDTFDAELFLTLWENVDQGGRDVSTFARDMFENAVVDGLAYILVDMPEGPADGETLADQRARNARPYFAELSAGKVVSIRWGFVNNRLTILQARILRTSVEYQGFQEIVHEEVLVLEPGKFAVWRKKQDASGDWFVFKQGTMSIPVVPLVPVYTGYKRPFYAEPPLEDLSYLNLEHFQIRSDQRNALSIASFPILAVTGWKKDEDGDGEVSFGPNKAIIASSPDAEITWVESQGNHLTAGRTELQDLEKEMRTYGAQLEVPTQGAETATGRALDASEALSPLQAWAMGVERALQEAFKLAAMWMGKGEETNVDLKITVAPSTIGTRDTDLRSLDTARARGDISRPAYLNELQRRGVLSEDFDAEEDEKLLDDESLGGGTGEPQDITEDDEEDGDEEDQQ